MCFSCEIECPECIYDWIDRAKFDDYVGWHYSGTQKVVTIPCKDCIDNYDVPAEFETDDIMTEGIMGRILNGDQHGNRYRNGR